MSTLSLRIPDSYHRRLHALAEREHVSINQLITTALGEKLSALDTEALLKGRVEKASKAKFLKALKRVPGAEPAEEDRLPAR